jgi:hypothetical protein
LISLNVAYTKSDGSLGSISNGETAQGRSVEVSSPRPRPMKNDGQLLVLRAYRWSVTCLTLWSLGASPTVYFYSTKMGRGIPRGMNHGGREG